MINLSPMPDPLCLRRSLAGLCSLVRMASRKQPMRARPVYIMSVSMDEFEETKPEPPPKRKASPSCTSSQSAKPFAMSDTQLHHLLLAKGMVGVYLTSIVRRLQRRLSSALQAPSLRIRRGA